LTDEVQEIHNSRENAIKIFAENNLEFIGWYQRYDLILYDSFLPLFLYKLKSIHIFFFLKKKTKSNFQSNSNSIPTQSDIIKHTTIAVF
jgi:hypothetical protein